MNVSNPCGLTVHFECTTFAGMKTSSDICDVIGRQRLAALLGVTKAAITNAASEGTFPPRWYRVIKAECEAKGEDCPPELFRFAEPNAPLSDEGATA